MVEVLPFLIDCFLNHFWDGDRLVDGYALKVFGFDSSERHSDPLDARLCPHKPQVFKFCGLGKVMQKDPRRVYVREGSEILAAYGAEGNAPKGR